MIINMNGAKAPETPSPVLQEKTVTPETLPTVIGADEGYDGLSQVTVNPDSQLKAENIRSGKTIFGVTGAFVGEPVYTNTIDYSLIVSSSQTSTTIPMGFITSDISDLGESSTLDISKRSYYDSINSAFIGLQTGAISSYIMGLYKQPNKSSTTYIPSATWYHGSATFNGTYECFMGKSIGELVGNDINGNIRGSGWLIPTMLFYRTPTNIVMADAKVADDSYQHVVLGESIPVDVDTNFIVDSTGKHFSIEVPSVEVDIYGAFSYGTFYKRAVGLLFVPNKIVIS